MKRSWPLSTHPEQYEGMSRFPARNLRYLVVCSLLFSLVASVLSISGAYGSTRTTVKLNVTQTGNNLDLRWSYTGTAPRTQQIRLLDGTRTAFSVSLAGKARKTRLEAVRPGRYSLELRTTKPTLTTRRSVTVYAAPSPVVGLQVQLTNSVARLSWTHPAGDLLGRAQRVTISVRSGTQQLPSVAISGDAVNYDLEAVDPAKEYVVGISVSNVAGTSLESVIRFDGDGGVDTLTGKSLLTLVDAEALFDSYAIVNRSPLGPVDLSDVTQTGLNPVMAGLQRCVLDGRSVGGRTNIGGVWATRNPSGALILTSGALALPTSDAAALLESNSGLGGCVDPVLRTQLQFVAGALSPNAKVSSVSAGEVVADPARPGLYHLKLEAKVYPNGGLAGEVEQDLQLVWLTLGSSRTLSQHLLIRQGTPIDQPLIEEFRTLVWDRHRL